MEQGGGNDTDISGEESPPSLLEFMPAGVLFEIFQYLDWNNLCVLSQTCTKFRDLCQQASLWVNLKTLDFRNCAIPIAEKILNIVRRSPRSETVFLGDVISNDMDELVEQQSNVVGADRFVLDLLRACPRLKTIHLFMEEITDRAVEAIAAKCVELEYLGIHDNPHIDRRTVIDLLSASDSIRQLCIVRCDNISFLSVKHSDPTQTLKLTKICLIDLGIESENVRDLLLGCPCLTDLDLSLTQHLDNIPNDIPPGTPSGLDTLQHLTLQYCNDLTTVDMYFAPNLESLDISHCYRAMRVTAECPKLRVLETKGCFGLQKVILSACDIQEISFRGMAYLQSLTVNSSSLRTLNIGHCCSLTADEILSCIKYPENIVDLNVEGCKHLTPTDLSSRLLPLMKGLQTLTYGGHSLQTAVIEATSLRRLTFSGSLTATCLPLSMPELRELKLSDHRDFVEQETLDGLLYGKQVVVMQGLEKLLDNSSKDLPFQNGTGTPKLEVLKLEKLACLHGSKLSSCLKYFTHLRELELIQCSFLVNVTLEDCSNLISVKIDSCAKLSSVTVRAVPGLKYLDVRCCSMLKEFSVSADNLESLDVYGTNFCNARVDSGNLMSLELQGVCTQSSHSLQLRCGNLRQLSLLKCDRLSDANVQEIFDHSSALTSVNLVGSLSLTSLMLPASLSTCSLTGHRLLREIKLQEPVNIHHFTLNNLPKFTPALRQALLQQCESTLKILDVRAIPGETTLTLQLQNLTSLTLDQGINLSSLEIKCQKLHYLRIQGCPRLQHLRLHISSLSQLQVYHSSPLLALKSLALHVHTVTHLATVLAHYCPKLEELALHGCNLASYQLNQLAKTMSSLTTVHLVSCHIPDLPPLPVDQGTMVIGGATISREGDNITVNIAR